jgi:hypothetical protein
VSDTYIRAAESYIQAMRTGESSAARQATAYLADDVVLIAGGERTLSRDQVSARITGQWPMTPVYLLLSGLPPKYLPSRRSSSPYRASVTLASRC